MEAHALKEIARSSLQNSGAPARRSRSLTTTKARRKRYSILSLKEEIQTVLAEMRREVRIRALLHQELIIVTTEVEKELILGLIQSSRDAITGLEQRCRRIRSDAVIMGIEPEELEGKPPNPVRIDPSTTVRTLR